MGMDSWFNSGGGGSDCGKTSGANESISGEQRHLPTDMMLDIPVKFN